MQGRFKMEYRLFTIVRYNYGYYNTLTLTLTLALAPRTRSVNLVLAYQHSLFEPHNLNHVSVFPLTLRLPLRWPVHAYCSPHPLPLPYLVCWLININNGVIILILTSYLSLS
jgi:hypothetical protein